MKKILLALVLSSVPAFTVPAAAQSYEDQRRWERAQDRYRAETDIYNRERERFMSLRGRGRGYDQGSRYNDTSRYNDRDPYATDYDASRYYRDDPRYQERRLSEQDMVYRGSDGRYYCKRNDGTTGLIVGGVAGGLLGNVIDGGRRRTGGTLIGGALGALMGRSIEQNQQDVRCR